MNTIRFHFNNLKKQKLEDEYSSIINKDIIKLYDTLVDISDDSEIYDSAVFLLMSDYLFPPSRYPLMREKIKKLYNYKDSYILDNEYIKNVHKHIISQLLNESNFEKAYNKLEKKQYENDEDQYLLDLIKDNLENRIKKEIKVNKTKDDNINIEKVQNTISDENKKTKSKIKKTRGRPKKNKLIEIITDNQKNIDEFTNNEV